MSSSSETDPGTAVWSIEKKRSFLEGLIYSSPPGEVREVYEDLKAILQDDGTLQSIAENTFKKYNCENFVVVKLPNIEEFLILSWYGVLPDGRTVDPRSKKAFKFNHFTKRAYNFETYIQNPKLESLRSNFEVHLDEYVKERYPMGHTCVHSADGEIQMIIVNARFSPNKYINGSWSSAWEYNPDSGSLRGSLKIRVHYYEDGNVQLKVSKSISHTVFPDRKDTDKWVSSVIGTICTSEDEFQASAKEKFDHMNDKGFKNLRKLLPITKTKINWDCIEAYGVVGMINKQK